MKPDILKWGRTNEKGEVHSKCGRFYILPYYEEERRYGYCVLVTDPSLKGGGSPNVAKEVWWAYRLGDAKVHAQNWLYKRLDEIRIARAVSTAAMEREYDSFTNDP